MASTKSNVRKLKTQPNLTDQEIKRIAEKLAVALDHDTEEIGLITMLFDHLQNLADDDDARGKLWSTFNTIKSHLFIGTDEQISAQKQFQASAYANRGKLLLWPYERKGAE